MAAGGAGDRARRSDVGETLSTETEAESERQLGLRSLSLIRRSGDLFT